MDKRGTAGGSPLAVMMEECLIIGFRVSEASTLR